MMKEDVIRGKIEKVNDQWKEKKKNDDGWTCHQKEKRKVRVKEKRKRKISMWKHVMKNDTSSMKIDKIARVKMMRWKWRHEEWHVEITWTWRGTTWMTRNNDEMTHHQNVGMMKSHISTTSTKLKIKMRWGQIWLADCPTLTTPPFPPSRNNPDSLELKKELV